MSEDETPVASQETESPPLSSRKEAELQDDAATELEDLLEAGHGETLVEIFEVNLGGPITNVTYQDLLDSLSVLLSTEGLGTVTWLAMGSGIGNRLNALPVSDETRTFLLRLMARYSARIQRAVSASTVGISRGRDWRRLIPSLVQDQDDDDEYEFRVEIERFDGETMALVGDPGSMVRLARRFILMLDLAKDPSIFPEDDVSKLIEVMSSFSERVKASATSDGATEAE